MWRPALCSVVILLALLLQLQTAESQSQWVIQRNNMDCMWPAIKADAAKLWPTSSYLPRGNSLKRIRGGLKATSTAGFTIEYFSTYKIITNLLVNEKYLLYHCGTEPPSVPGITKVFEGPLSSASIADATAADFMTQITLMDRVAFASELAVSGCLQAIAACGYVAPSDDTDKSPIRANTDAFWIFGFGPSTDPMSISFNAVSASKPLERLKWIAYVAAFFNKEYAANAVYSTVRANYLNLRRDVITTPLQGEPPLVCWVYKDWDGDFAMSYAQYKVEYVKDAGGVMWDWQSLIDSGMTPKPAGSTTTLVFKSTQSDVVVAWGGVLQQCNIIIDESWEQSTGGLTKMDGQNPDGFLQKHGVARYASQIPAVTAKRVYTVAKTTGVPVTNPSSPVLGYIGLDWFERGVSRADWVLRDLVQVIRPDVDAEQSTRWEPRFMLRLDGIQQQTRVAAKCDLDTAKLNNCKRSTKAARICPNAVRNCDTGVLEYPRLDKRCAAVSQQDSTWRKRRREGKQPWCQTSPA